MVFSSPSASARPPSRPIWQSLPPPLTLLFEVVTNQHSYALVAPSPASLRLMEQKHVLASDASNHILSDHREGA